MSSGVVRVKPPSGSSRALSRRSSGPRSSSAGSHPRKKVKHLPDSDSFGTSCGSGSRSGTHRVHSVSATVSLRLLSGRRTKEDRNRRFTNTPSLLTRLDPTSCPRRKQGFRPVLYVVPTVGDERKRRWSWYELQLQNFGTSVEVFSYSGSVSNNDWEERSFTSRTVLTGQSNFWGTPDLSHLTLSQVPFSVILDTGITEKNCLSFVHDLL